MAKIKAKTEPNDSRYTWMAQHNEAIDYPKGFEVPVVRMLLYWAKYAEEHNKRFESPIGEDYVLGPQWQTLGESIRGLLNGETGRLDCGTLDGFILQTMRENGFDKMSDGGVL